MIFEFSKPIIIKDKEVKELELNLESLTGEQLIDVEKEFSMSRPNFMGVMETNKEYLILVAAKSAKLPAEELIKLPAKDFTKLSMTVMGFLLA